VKNRLALFAILVLVASLTNAFAQIEESNEDEGLSKADLIRKYCYRGSDGIMYDKEERKEICPYGVSTEKLLSGQITVILIILGIIALIFTGFLLSRERKRIAHVKKALNIIASLQKAEIGDMEQLKSIKQKLENKTPVTEDEITYLRENMRQLEENELDR